MKNSNLVLGLDTSNYTTSVAVIDENGEIVRDLRKPLQVKQGERGLRQSHALFQHLENLPELLADILDSPLRQQLRAVSVSEKPRPVEGSYMPVFNAGVHFGSVVAKSLQVPFFRFSHQEGHLAAAVHHTSLAGRADYLAWHLSGGTCELLDVENGLISIIGGSKDLSFGQLIDRVGVAMGLSFPCGNAMDHEALEQQESLTVAKSDVSQRSNPLTPIPISDLSFNVSGIETQAQRLFSEKGSGELSLFLFQRIGRCLADVTKIACQQKNRKNTEVLFTGGVAASGYLRAFLQNTLQGTAATPIFGAASLSSDNAVGISLLGGQALWH